MRLYKIVSSFPFIKSNTGSPMADSHERLSTPEEFLYAMHIAKSKKKKASRSRTKESNGSRELSGNRSTVTPGEWGSNTGPKGHG
jgi:hypothetical protein